MKELGPYAELANVRDHLLKGEDLARVLKEGKMPFFDPMDDQWGHAHSCVLWDKIRTLLQQLVATDKERFGFLDNTRAEWPQKMRLDQIYYGRWRSFEDNMAYRESGHRWCMWLAREDTGVHPVWGFPGFYYEIDIRPLTYTVAALVCNTEAQIDDASHRLHYQVHRRRCKGFRDRSAENFKPSSWTSWPTK